MFYRPEDGHGLPHNPFKAVVSPRPIGWISTRGPLGDNLAPYSFFNAIADDPPQVMFAGGLKDTIRNVEATGVFAVNPGRGRPAARDECHLEGLSPRHG